MTAQKLRKGTYQTNRSIFGGKIYDFDFNGQTSMCDIASRIESDWKFDKKCRQNLEQRDKKKEIV